MSKGNKAKVRKVLDWYEHEIEDGISQVEIEETDIPDEYKERFWNLIGGLRVLHDEIYEWNEARK